MPLDDALVAQARTTFSRVSLASRAYSRIKPSAAAQSLPPWKPSDVLGPAGVRVFTRASGKKLSDGVPGFFTVDGFHKVLLPALPVGDARGRLGKLGDGAESARQSRPTRSKPSSPNSVVKLYLDDYAKAWDGVIQDLEIVALRSLNAGGSGSLRPGVAAIADEALLTAIARQVTLSEPPKPTAAEAAAVEAAAKAKGGASGPGDVARRRRAFLGACRPARCGAGAAARP